MSPDGRQGASFRDPAGFLFTRNGMLYRQVNQAGMADYERMMESGLYNRLVGAGWLVPHEEVDEPACREDIAWRILRPERVGFISYPYEWCFSQLKDAALLTLDLQKVALDAGMVLKDASAYNFQFHRGRPVLIDTLSFEIYEDGCPWTAYRQFCQHFLAPLALMALTDVRLGQLLRVYIDGIPLDLAASLLPGKTRLDFGLGAHIHAHAAAQRKYSGTSTAPDTARKMGKTAMLGLIDSLESTVRKLSWRPQGEWSAYYTDTNYTPSALEQKKQIVSDFLAAAGPETVWDLGANTGVFSRLASSKGIPTVAFDIDPGAVELNYRECRKNQETGLLPLVLDLTNPSPGLGWAGAERHSLLERAPAGCSMALALIHHLAISNNVPLPLAASFFAQCSRWLIIEFVPKQDSQVKRLLATRADIFPEYTREGFEAAFSTCFRIRQSAPVPGSERTLYLMERLLEGASQA